MAEIVEIAKELKVTLELAEVKKVIRQKQAKIIMKNRFRSSFFQKELKCLF